jgi:hypothetical protein
MVVMNGGQLAITTGGVVQALPSTSGDLLAVAARLGGGYATYDGLRSTFVEPTGATTFSMGAPLPAGLGPQQRGMARDSADVLSVAGGSGGAWTSVDGFGSSAGYVQIRKPAVGSSPAGAIYTQIGVSGPR